MRRLANFRHHGPVDSGTLNRKEKAKNFPPIPTTSRLPTGTGPYPVSQSATQPLSPTSGNAGPTRPIEQEFGDPYNENHHPQSFISNSDHSPVEKHDQQPVMSSNRSTAPTFATNPETIHSEAGLSRHGTSYTMGGGKSSTSGGGNSVFSSPNHSSRSLTTTLTTIQSSATSTVLNQGQGTAPAGSHTGHHHHQAQPSQSSTYFSHQYPQTPVSAIPQHLNPHASHLPLTYRSATANNLLTDNASIMTLASSTHPRGRRNSLDTNASIRAIPPTSTWGGSRESLPLSTFSQTESYGASAVPSIHNVTSPTGGMYQSQQRPSIGVASAERISAYGSIASPEHTSTIGSRSLPDVGSGRGGPGTDGGSVRGGLTGYGRNHSVSETFSSMNGSHGVQGFIKD